MSHNVQLILLVLFAAISASALSNVGTFQLQQPNSPSFVFWYNDVLHIGVGIFNGPVTGMQGQLMRMNLINDVITVNATLQLPLTCNVLSCNIGYNDPILVGNQLTVTGGADGCCTAYHFGAFTIDLDKWVITSQYVSRNTSLDGELSAFSATTAQLWQTVPYFGGYRCQVSSVSLPLTGPKNIGSFVPLGFEYAINIGGSASLNHVYVCGTPGLVGDTETFQVLDANTYQTIDSIKNVPCGYMVLTSNNLLIVAFYNSNAISIAVVNTSAPLPKKLSKTIIDKGGYVNGLASNGQYAFIVNRLFSNQSISTLIQVDISKPQSPIVVATAELPQPFFMAQEYQPAMTNYVISDSSNMLAGIVVQEYSNSNPGVMIFNF